MKEVERGAELARKETAKMVERARKSMEKVPDILAQTSAAIEATRRILNAQSPQKTPKRP